MIRKATMWDMAHIEDMGRKFHAASGQPHGFNAQATMEFVGGMIESPSAIVLVSNDGFIGGTLSPAYCDPDWIMAVELFWWAGGSGLKLLKAFEEWAIKIGANEVRMTSLISLDRAGKILTRKGYQAAEISYTRII